MCFCNPMNPDRVCMKNCTRGDIMFRPVTPVDQGSTNSVASPVTITLEKDVFLKMRLLVDGILFPTVKYHDDIDMAEIKALVEKDRMLSVVRLDGILNQILK